MEERIARLVVAERLPAAREQAGQVWVMNRNATMNSETTMARPARFFLPVDSSANVEMPSNPRKLSTAIGAIDFELITTAISAQE
jgi:hypothetical protein